MQVGKYTLYPYQQEIIHKLRSEVADLISKGLPPHVILQAPCGAGKGVLTAFLADSCANKGNTFLFAVHGRSLVSQVSFKFAECGIRHGLLMANSHKSVDHEFASHNTKTVHQNPIVVASRDTYESRVIDRKTVQAINPEVIVLDEAHLGHSGKVYQKLLKENLSTVIIGMTATPATGAGYGFGDLYQRLIMGVSHKDLLEGGFLVPPVCFGPSTVNMTGVDVGTNGEFVQDQAAALFDKEELIGDLIRDWKLYSERRPTIVYAQSVPHSIHIAELFNGQGIRAEHVDADTPLKKRKEVYHGLATGEIKVVTNYGVLRVGVDIPEAGCGVLACGMNSLNAYLQSVGRLGRSCKSVFWNGGKPKENFICIAEGSPVLTRRGLVKIEEIKCNDEVWDGVNWVGHEGVVCNGERDIISYCGLSATPDHEVWTPEGWRTLESCRAMRLPVAKTGDHESAIRVGVHYVRADLDSPVWQQKAGVCPCSVQEVQLREPGASGQPEERQDERLPKLPPAEAVSDVVLVEGFSGAPEMYEPKTQALEELWRQGNSVPLSRCHFGLPVDLQESRDSQGAANRSHREQRALRARQPSLVDQNPEFGTYQEDNDSVQDSQIQDSLSRDQIRGQYHVQNVQSRNDARADPDTMEAAVVKTKRRVWDILNAGPLRRFTVSGILVHNCIDHGGNLARHGWPQMDRYWTLDPETTVQERTQEQQKELPENKKEAPILHCKCCGAEWQADGQGGGCPYCGQTCSRTGSQLCFNGERLERITEDSAHVNPHQKAWTSCLFIAAQRNMSYGATVKMFEQRSKVSFRTANVSPKIDFNDRQKKIPELFPNLLKRKKSDVQP